MGSARRAGRRGRRLVASRLDEGPDRRAGAGGRPDLALVLDLDGDGVELTSLSTSQAAFDLDADGFAEHTGWVKADDGLLVLDRDGNGRIDDISELFGSDTAADGFIKLAELDQNGDGLIDAGDAHFADLRVWTDQDQDGFSDATELKSLQELNVASISLDAQAVSQTIEGNSVSAIASPHRGRSRRRLRWQIVPIRGTDGDARNTA